MTTEQMQEIYNAATRTDAPALNCDLKEISPNVFAWVERRPEDDRDDDDN